MTRLVHRMVLTTYTSIVVFTTIALTFIGFSFYNVPIEDRYFHPDYSLLKPSGILGHGLGIAGTIFILVGIFSYMARKRFHIFSRIGLLKYWLDFHIFLCVLGSTLILFHTSFKFGGVVAIGFWSMVVVLASGVIGRYIYLQIPRSIGGRELSLIEVQRMKDELESELKNKYNIEISLLSGDKLFDLSKYLQTIEISASERKKVKQLLKNQRKISTRIDRLDMMKNIFKFWHVAHLPFALILLIIMVIHVGVVLTLGYKWIF